MPRRDGYPTNQELLADFTAASHEAFMMLYDIHMQPSLPPAFEGKPLRSLGMHVLKRHFEDERPPESIESEELTVATLDISDIAHMENNPSSAHAFPPDIIEYYEAIAAHIGQVALTGGLCLREYLPPAGVVSNYTARFPCAPAHYINTLKERPSKIDIMGARYFVEEVQRYAASGQSQMNPVERLEDAAYHGEDGVITHNFTLTMDIDLPLNGYESTDFLIAYKESMLNYAQKERNRLQEMKNLGTPQAYLDHILLRIDMLMLAAERAQAILNTRF